LLAVSKQLLYFIQCRLCLFHNEIERFEPSKDQDWHLGAKKNFVEFECGPNSEAGLIELYGGFPAE
jgi:hypothetical protein